MAKYRKRPVVVEAVRWFKNGDHDMVVERFYRHALWDAVCKQCHEHMRDHGWIDTLEGGHVVCPGDWIITGVNGEHYPCKPDVFDRTYDPVEGE